MAKGTTKVTYDGEEDILSFTKGRKIKASIDIGDFIIDVDTNGFITGIEILNASKNLKVSQEQLEGLLEASMNVNYKPNYVYIHLFMTLENKEKELTIPLTIDLGHSSVRTDNIKFAVA